MVSAFEQGTDEGLGAHPNNDSGSDEILTAYARLHGNVRFKALPSMRCEYFRLFLVFRG